jgi:hypothetical protein
MELIEDDVFKIVITSNSFGIIEVMTTPSQFGDNLNGDNLNKKIRKAKNKIKESKDKLCTYIFVFPINTIGAKEREKLEKFKFEYQNYVSIKFYDYQTTETFIQEVIKLHPKIETENDLVSHIQSIRSKYLGRSIN